MKTYRRIDDDVLFTENEDGTYSIESLKHKYAGVYKFKEEEMRPPIFELTSIDNPDKVEV